MFHTLQVQGILSHPFPAPQKAALGHPWPTNNCISGAKNFWCFFPAKKEQDKPPGVGTVPSVRANMGKWCTQWLLQVWGVLGQPPSAHQQHQHQHQHSSLITCVHKSKALFQAKGGFGKFDASSSSHHTFTSWFFGSQSSQVFTEVTIVLMARVQMEETLEQLDPALAGPRGGRFSQGGLFLKPNIWKDWKKLFSRSWLQGPHNTEWIPHSTSDWVEELICHEWQLKNQESHLSHWLQLWRLLQLELVWHSKMQCCRRNKMLTSIGCSIFLAATIGRNP